MESLSTFWELMTQKQTQQRLKSTTKKHKNGSKMALFQLKLQSQFWLRVA